VKWLIWKGQDDTNLYEVQFDARYNAVNQSVTIYQTEPEDYDRVQERYYDSFGRISVSIYKKTYYLRSGNLFVARFDWNNKPIVTQLSYFVS